MHLNQENAETLKKIVCMYIDGHTAMKIGDALGMPEWEVRNALHDLITRIRFAKPRFPRGYLATGNEAMPNFAWWCHTNAVKISTLARSIGVDEGTLRYWIKGERNITVKAAMRLSQLTGLSLEELTSPEITPEWASVKAAYEAGKREQKEAKK